MSITVKYSAPGSYPVVSTAFFEGEELSSLTGDTAVVRLHDFLSNVEGGNVTVPSAILPDLAVLVEQFFELSDTMHRIASEQFTSTNEKPQYVAESDDEVDSASRIFIPQEAAQQSLERAWKRLAG